MEDDLGLLLGGVLKLYTPLMPEQWNELLINVELVEEDIDVVACVQTDDINSQQMLPEVDGIEIKMAPVVKILQEKQTDQGELTEAKITVSNSMEVSIELHFQFETV